MLCCAGNSLAAGIEADDAGYATALEKRRRVVQVNLLGIGLVSAWGIYKWDYFTQSPNAGSEGWFGNGTDEGGADKLGHLYASYAATHGLAYLYENWRFERDEAALYGALSSWAIMGFMEFGDSFSDFGFSMEDLLFNTVGSAFGYLLYQNTDLAGKIDLRWEYGIHPSGGGVFTDYENTKVLLALKLNGFKATRRGLLKHLELHLGYYTRGFDDHESGQERNLYVGIGVNLTDLLRRHGHAKTATVLNYLQLPGTYLSLKHDFNR
jgi:hypothetical protein